jgi:hypothetical protein
MAYKVYWEVPQQVLRIELEGNLTIEDFGQINRAVIDLLGVETTRRQINLLIDITRPSRTPRDIQQIKSSQTYVMRRDLKHIFVAGTDKFMRLMMLLTFNLCKPSLTFVDTIDRALATSAAMRESVG